MKANTYTSGNVVILYGGGQIPSANYVLGMFAEKLLQLGHLVFGVHKSFLGLSDSSCYERFTLEKARNIQKMPGTYLSTCRDVDPADDKYFDKIMEIFKQKNIRTICLPGGDGSSRAGRDFAQRTKEIGYPIQIVFVPCTIDGIANSDTIGIDSAVAESTRHAISMISNAVATWRPKYKVPRIAIIEIQGRNRNDIAVGVMDNVINNYIEKYSIDDIKVIFIPAGYDWTISNLIEKITSEDEKCAIIASEGAKPKDIYWNAIQGSSIGQKIENIIKSTGLRETNFDAVGYLSQTNDSIHSEEIRKIDQWINYAIFLMLETDESIAVIKNGEKFRCMPLKDFADATNSKTSIPLSEEEVGRFKNYLI